METDLDVEFVLVALLQAIRWIDVEIRYARMMRYVRRQT